MLQQPGPLLGTMQFTLKMDTATSSETMVFYSNTTWRRNPEDVDFNLRRIENIKSHNMHFVSRLAEIQINNLK
jgi:hypothetical protein